MFGRFRRQIATLTLPCEQRDHRSISFSSELGRSPAIALQASTVASIRRYRIDGLRLWELRDCGWFIHTCRHVPERIVRVIVRSDGRQVPIYNAAHYERVSTKQASKKELRDAQTLLQQDPLTTL